MTAYNIRKNWITSFELIVTNPVVIFPFIIVAFLEGLALELLYYFPQRPLANIVGPIVRRFLGEAFMHYPANLIALPKLFYYAQILIYVFAGVFLASISVNIFKHIKRELLLRADTLIKDSCKRYLSLLGFGIIMIVVMFCLRKIGVFVSIKAIELVSGNLSALSRTALQVFSFVSALVLFLANIIIETFLVLTVPMIIIKERPLLKALGGSISLGSRNFLSIFTLIFWPFLIYLPIALLKVDLAKLVNKTFPEITVFILIAGIILAAFVECFVIVCAAQFLADKDKFLFLK